ncbi:IS5 family transposase [Actinospica sp. MGRD01-02]|uniref:IS5 family transposase n=1 Tax=Actinospica acidithermotolerans TaxID=2828514 RepID=A0A941IF55_9ACTN|nr:IS5 family transposase [Actinospica acidithermotolerans]
MNGVGPRSPVDRARPGSKHHLIVEGWAIPLAASLTGGNRHDSTQLFPLIDAIPRVRTGGRGRPRSRPKTLYADRGYDYPVFRRRLWRRGIQPKIAKRGAPHGSGLGKVRVVERTFAWLHGMRRLRVRYERRADIHEAFLKLGVCVIALRHVIRLCWTLDPRLSEHLDLRWL